MESNYFIGKITFATIISFLDNKYFEQCFNNINKINSNAIKKTDFEHFVSVLFGKLAEIFVAQNIKKSLSKENLNLDLIYSPMENGYEVADLKIVDKNNNFKLIEVRSSFQENIQENLNHIIRYLNHYKTKETYKDYYFQVFFNENKNNIYQKLDLIFNKYQEFKKLFKQENKNDITFKSFLFQDGKFNDNDLEVQLCNIINYSFISKEEIQENLNNHIQIKHLKQSNTYFEAKLLKYCLNSKQGIEIICNDFNKIKKSNLLNNKIKTF